MPGFASVEGAGIHLKSKREFYRLLVAIAVPCFAEINGRTQLFHGVNQVVDVPLRNVESVCQSCWRSGALVRNETIYSFYESDFFK